MSDKNKKKTLTISTGLKKNYNFDTASVDKKKSYSIPKKKDFNNKFSNRKKLNVSQPPSNNDKSKRFSRRVVEQQATKAFIKKDEKTTGKSKLKLKAPVDKRDFKMTVSRALNVEEIEIKQRSLASVRRARLKEKKTMPDAEIKKEFKKVIKEVNVPEKITIQELSNRMAEKSSDIIKFLFNMKVIATINHTIDKDTAEYIVKEFGHKAILEEAPSIEISKDKKDYVGVTKKRSPVVTIMGHVDHGKTSLLDALRNTNVVSGEFGGITQHIGAYQVKSEDNKIITFIDTPGHAAFTEMRARGSKITDIVVLVVAADDGIKPQTVEAIKHAQAAKVPIIVAINKCDLPNKNISKIKNEMMQYNLIAEDLSGDTLFVEVSATQKINLDKLKESILLQAEILDLKAPFTGPAKGVVVESKIDKGKGPISTILITIGLLNKGDYFVCGNTWGKIRAMINYDGENLEQATPSMPVEILGMNNSAFAGAEFSVCENEDEAKEISKFRSSNHSDQKNIISVEKTNLFEKAEKKRELNIIIKTDVHGTSEAIEMAIKKIDHPEVKPKIILCDIGMINETDVTLAKASEAVLIGFNVKPNREAKKMAEDQNVTIEYFNIIYKALEFIENNLSGLLEPETKENTLGSAEIKKVFKVSSAGKVAGCKVTDGEIKNKSKARIIREGVVIYEGEISSVFREKNEVKDAKSGMECGINLKDFIDFKERDIIESYIVKKVERSI
ncbi:MAG: translation initiation factor IF-2 [Candidatus Pelagibacter sp.]|nr:translation initiation factor IF-2 [Candidatus Pelagibacter sp.]OUW23984.1 MAG: translation initiation factor IF-2 [Rickettsiales bacterium TMED174]